ncbi:MAG: YigZ family protein [Saprospiraceae bacterium]|nr:YigZ family protein [Saprospiraceae bacterium]
MKDLYHTIAKPAYGEFKDRGSKFHAYAFPVYTEQEWQEALEEIKKEHFKARHHCYAFRLGLDGNNFRANDDGEPSGTAGRPILGQIDSFGLTNVFIVVVRYFGGTKLGASGLINAYKTSAQLALSEAEIIEKLVEDVYQMEFDYALMSDVMNTVKKLELDVLEQDFSESGKIKFALRQSEIEATLPQLRAGVANVRIEEIDQIESIDGFELSYLYTR